MLLAVCANAPCAAIDDARIHRAKPSNIVRLLSKAPVLAGYVQSTIDGGRDSQSPKPADAPTEE
jgi:hypothetical protein